MIGWFKLVMHSGYGIFELPSIFTYFHPFVPIFTRFFALLIVDGWWFMWTPTRFVWPLELG